VAFVKGSAPVLAVEFARRSIPGELRPTFKEFELANKRGGAAESPPPEQKK
jgi:chemotaxis protein MotA